MSPLKMKFDLRGKISVDFQSAHSSLDDRTLMRSHSLPSVDHLPVAVPLGGINLQLTW
jgi:hypothetical protein